jgi:DNA polymerase III subunit gamma/tau
VWDIRYRPLKFSDVLGQEGNIKLLKSRLKNETAFDTSYIFSGQFGRGKTTLSRIFARAMLCQDLDKNDPEPCNKCDNCQTILAEQPGPFGERDTASQGTVEHMRAIVEELPYVLSNAPKRIYLFDEAHRMSLAAQDVLLSPLENKKMVGMFCTTEAEKIRGAIRSRCEEYPIRKVSREDILKRMQYILRNENIQFEDDAVYIVIDHSGAHVRDVINKLEMLSQLGPLTVKSVRDYLNLSVVTLYYQILLSLNNPLESVELVEKACEQVSPEEVSVGLAEAAMNSYRLSNKLHVDFSIVDKGLAEKVYEKYKSDVVKFAYWFLGSKGTTKLSLVRDIVVFAQNPGNLPVENPTPPVVFCSSSINVENSPNTKEIPTHKETLSNPVKSLEVAETPKTDETINLSEYSDLERIAINSQLPRMAKKEEIFKITKSKNIEEMMLPEEWKRKFEQLWKKNLDLLVRK